MGARTRAARKPAAVAASRRPPAVNAAPDARRAPGGRGVPGRVSGGPDGAGKAHGSGAPAGSEEEHPRARLQVQEELPAGARRVDEILEGVLPRRPGELRPEACKPRLLGRA